MDKVNMHPGYKSGALNKDLFVAVDRLMQYCANEMSQGCGYPRRVEGTELDKQPKPWDPLWNKTRWIELERLEEVQYSPLWNASKWDAMQAGPAVFPRRQRRCRQCTMDDAVSAHLRAPFVPFWIPYPLLPRTLNDYVEFCHCSIAIAMTPYNHIFDVSTTDTVISWSRDTKISLAWLALRWNITYPSLLAYLLPQFILHGFRDENLPPRGIHYFWFDEESAGLSHIAGQPAMLTNKLREWGRDGVDQEINELEARKEAMSPGEREACVKQGWCFWKDWDLLYYYYKDSPPSPCWDC
jgi:hypothetical protein